MQKIARKGGQKREKDTLEKEREGRKNGEKKKTAIIKTNTDVPLF